MGELLLKLLVLPPCGIMSSASPDGTVQHVEIELRGYKNQMDSRCYVGVNCYFFVCKCDYNHIGYES